VLGVEPSDILAVRPLAVHLIHGRTRPLRQRHASEPFLSS
jgi:hypothetical protein